MKKIIITFLGFLLVFSLNPTKSSAASVESVSSGSINLNNLEELIEENPEIETRLMTYEEFLQDRATAKGISLEDAKEMYPKSDDTFRLAENRSNQMLEIKIPQMVRGGLYQPAVQLFIWGYYSGSFRQFKYIQAVDLDRNGVGNNYTAKEYRGKLEAKLTSDYQVWWRINGDFYLYGTTELSVSGGGEKATIGKTVTGTFSLTKELNHYEYFEDAATYSLN